MTILQSALAQLAQTNLDQDTLGALDACLAVFDLATTPPVATPQLIEHTTKLGRVIKGLILTVGGMTKTQAQLYDPYTFWKTDSGKSGWFIRSTYIDQIPPDFLKPNAVMPTQKTPTDGASRVHAKYGTTVKSSRHLRWLQRNHQHLDRD